MGLIKHIKNNFGNYLSGLFLIGCAVSFGSLINEQGKARERRINYFKSHLEDKLPSDCERIINVDHPLILFTDYPVGPPVYLTYKNKDNRLIVKKYSPRGDGIDFKWVEQDNKTEKRN